MLVACSCICKLVNFGWSVSRSMGRKYPGLLKMSLRPEFFNHCPAGSAAEFFQSGGGFAIPLFLPYLNFTYIWKWLHSGHVLVKSGTDVQLES